MFRHIFAVVAVRDIDIANAWYEKLFDRRADNNPVSTLVEWQAAPGAWVQVTVDIVEANKGVRLSTATDPDGNSITAIGGFREHY